MSAKGGVRHNRISYHCFKEKMKVLMGKQCEDKYVGRNTENRMPRTDYIHVNMF